LAIKTNADKHAANVLPLIREAQKHGATALRDIADALNARGVSTARGGKWYATSVKNMLERAWEVTWDTSHRYSFDRCGCRLAKPAPEFIFNRRNHCLLYPVGGLGVVPAFR
jgi:hypothetical protein